MKYLKEALIENSIDLIELDQKIRDRERELLILKEQRDSILHQMRTNVSTLQEK